MERAKERLVQWLKDAHAMEAQAETMLKGMASRLEHYDELRHRVEQHVQETQAQAKKIEQCLDRCGAGTSALKDMAGKTTGMGQALSGLFVGDEVVKGALAGYTFEHFEIASYQALITTAEAAGETEIAEVCRGILKEEEAMANWLREHLPVFTRAFLAREGMDQPAKR